MDSFKIKLPDSVLSEHLNGLSPKSRNFELVRLAMNGLLMEKGVFSIGTPSSSTNKKIIPADVQNNEKISTENVESNIRQSKINNVDFGMDITNM